MSSQKIPIILNLLAAVLGAWGQYYFKRGSQILAVTGSPFNLQIFLGLFLFCMVTMFFVISYKLGGQISIVYPFYATTFAWGVLIGVVLEKEIIKPLSLVGLGFILVGVSTLAYSVKS